MDERQAICPISGDLMTVAFAGTVLCKYNVTYYYCEQCGLLKTERPYWLNEAYQDAISDTDTGLVARNISNCEALDVVLDRLGVQDGKLLDVGGGYGLLARLMRDKGYDCYTTDMYCKNIFAKGFEPRGLFKADALFAFEVFEHIEDPLRFLEDTFNTYSCKTLVFSTLTFLDRVPAPDWWYYSFETGQHITFYQPRTLSRLADRVGCKYQMLNYGLHLFSTAELSRRDALCFKYRRLYSAYVRHKRKGLSRTQADHIEMRNSLRERG